MKTRSKTGGAVALCLLLLAMRVGAQTGTRASAGAPGTTELAVLSAEERGATTPRDLGIIRAGARNGEAQTARVAVRALGRLERPELIADILPALRHSLPEIRAEAANAIGQAAQGWAPERSPKPAPRGGLDTASSALISRLDVEADADVRAVIAEALGRLPYVTAEQVEKGEQALLALMTRSESAPDRVGVARGLEEIVRLHHKLVPPPKEILDALRTLASLSRVQSLDGSRPVGRGPGPPTSLDPAKNARVRRLAMESLITAQAVDDDLIRRTAADPDGQVRRLAMLALSNPLAGSPDTAASTLKAGLADPSAIVRVQALKALWGRSDRDEEAGRGAACAIVVTATRDPEPLVALMALDQLAGCSSSDDAIALLEQTMNDASVASGSRGWHRRAHALVALASAAPAKAVEVLPSFLESKVWHLRVYAAHAAAALKDRVGLEKLARDEDDNVSEAAIQGLAHVAGHEADAVYMLAMERTGYQVLRAAAIALAGTGVPEAQAVLNATLGRLVSEGHDNSRDARAAIADTLRGLGVTAVSTVAPHPTTEMEGVELTALRRLAADRARITIRGLGSFELALITGEAPLSVLRFARLAQSGYYNGLTFHRVVPNFVIQGGSPGASEYVGAAAFMRDEVGRWPHVRGAVGISTRGRDTGDAQFFVDLVDNPRLDHEYTVFGHVLNGMDVVDAILEGDVIERIEIVDR